MRFSFLAVAILVIGCGGGEDEPAACSPVDGTYRVTFSEQEGGTCGEPGPTLAIFENGESVDDGSDDDSTCEGFDRSEACENVTDQTCTRVDGSTFEITGLATQVDGPGRLEGTVEFHETTPGEECRSVYDVVWQRL